MKIGLFIAQLRKDANMTQKDLANKLGITDRAISKWERNICLPDIMLFEELASIFNISVAELIKGERMKKNTLKDNEIVSIMGDIEKNTKNKYKYFLNIILIFLSSITLLSILINVSKPLYYMNKNYKVGMESSIGLIDRVKEQINILKNNQGKFNNEEYSTILSYINSIENLEIDRDNILYKKEYYTFNDLNIINKKYHIETWYILYQHELSNSLYNSINIYKILLKYDDQMFNKLIDINDNINKFNENIEDINSFMKNIYIFNSSSNKNIGTSLKFALWYNYGTHHKCLNDIIKVGGINE